MDRFALDLGRLDLHGSWISMRTVWTILTFMVCIGCSRYSGSDSLVGIDIFWDPLQGTITINEA